VAKVSKLFFCDGLPVPSTKQIICWIISTVQVRVLFEK